MVGPIAILPSPPKQQEGKVAPTTHRHSVTWHLVRLTYVVGPWRVQSSGAVPIDASSLYLRGTSQRSFGIFVTQEEELLIYILSFWNRSMRPSELWIGFVWWPYGWLRMSSIRKVVGHSWPYKDKCAHPFAIFCMYLKLVSSYLGIFFPFYCALKRIPPTNILIWLKHFDRNVNYF